MSIAYANRGMGLETLINHANAQYEAKGIANIKKVATPWKVVRNGGRIVNAFPESHSTVDYMGDYAGRSICFEAKSTKEETSFPLKNFETHQIEFMRKWKGIKFVLVEFITHQEIFLVTFDQLAAWWDQVLKRNGRKSIPYEWFCNNAKWVRANQVALDYLKHVEVAG